jgi:hypothetical protein
MFFIQSNLLFCRFPKRAEVQDLAVFVFPDCQSWENGLKITTAVEDAKNRYGIFGDQKRNHRAALETENP